MTDIQRCEVRPGRLAEWTFSPASVTAAAELPEDSRPPAYIQESHIRTARSVRDDGLFVPAWPGTSFGIPGRADPGPSRGSVAQKNMRLYVERLRNVIASTVP